jgi:hypothetical protein
LTKNRQICRVGGVPIVGHAVGQPITVSSVAGLDARSRDVTTAPSVARFGNAYGEAFRRRSVVGA